MKILHYGMNILRILKDNMTKEELNKYYYLQEEIKQLKDKISEIDSSFLGVSLINCEKFERHNKILKI